MARGRLVINRLPPWRCLPIETALNVFVIGRLILALAACASTGVIKAGLVAQNLVRWLSCLKLGLAVFLEGALVFGDAAIGNSALETMFGFGDLGDELFFSLWRLRQFQGLLLTDQV